MDNTNNLNNMELPDLGEEFDTSPSNKGQANNQKPTVFDLNQIGEKQGIPNVADAKNNKSAAKGAAVILMSAVVLFGGFWSYKNFIFKRQQENMATVESSASSTTSSKKLEVAPLLPQPLPESTPPTPSNGQPITIVDNQPQPVVQPQPVAMAPAQPVETLASKKFSAKLMGDDIGAVATDSPKQVGASPFAPNGGETDSNNGSNGKLASLLKPMQTGARTASIMKDPNMTMAKGTFIECILETRLDTSVAGLTSCVIPRDIYSENGRVLLVEKGSKAVGEYQNSVEQGMNRIFVLWTGIKTTNGVFIGLDSPSSDFLGGAGLPGKVNHHWFQRFGNALLFSVVQDGFSYLANRNSNNSGMIYQNTQGNTDKMIEEAMRATGNIPPTLTKNQGDRIGIIVGRDLYFGDVYDLKAQ